MTSEMDVEAEVTSHHFQQTANNVVIANKLTGSYGQSFHVTPETSEASCRHNVAAGPVVDVDGRDARATCQHTARDDAQVASTGRVVQHGTGGGGGGKNRVRFTDDSLATSHNDDLTLAAHNYAMISEDIPYDGCKGAFCKKSAIASSFPPPSADVSELRQKFEQFQRLPVCREAGPETSSTCSVGDVNHETQTTHL